MSEATLPGSFPPLDPDEFDAFYDALHGRGPYRWQARASMELAEGRSWDALSAPTGAGKTTLVECFLFALALQADRPDRTLGRRLFWVVDRRAVVDQVYEHAQTVIEALLQATDGPAQTVAARLRLLSRGVEPEVRLWRGGLTEELAADRKALLSPAACAVVCSTVDQIGSRLLFRGYGTSRRSRPIDAAITGTDSLIVLDEAHIARPFLDTVNRVAQTQSAFETPVPPTRLVAVSATPDAGRDHPFTLTAEELAEEPLATRLRARKLTRLATGAAQDRVLSAEAKRLARQGARVVGVIANTVSTARETLDRLREAGDVLLVIGPCRPLERAGLLDRIPVRGQRKDMERALFVVSTQTVEVGLDLDFDALTTACAPWPALVQRFGRLDRAGELCESSASIVQPPKKCPVYGEPTQETWEWLRERAGDGDRELDLGPDGIAELTAEGVPSGPIEPRSPILGDWHVQALMQTSHDPAPSPDVAFFLRGESASEAADVFVAWRADLDASETRDWTERVRARRPHAGELLPVSIVAARRFLRGQDAGAVALADVESLSAASTDAVDGVPSDRWAARVPPPGPDGALTPELISRPADVRPGDVLVVPSSYGGCDEFGWAPNSVTPVLDLGNLNESRPAILLDARLGVPDDLLSLAADALAGLEAEYLDSSTAYGLLVGEVREWMAAGAQYATELTAAHQARKVAETTGREGTVTVSTDVRHGLPSIVLTPRIPRARSQRARVPYDDHIKRVRGLAIEFAQALRLSNDILTTVEHAARWHDTGKLDPRFQAWLNGGSPADPLAPLATSGRPIGDARDNAARVAAGWPRGGRHEQLSAALAASVSDWPTGVDRDLLIHLVATHHGDGRPARIHVADTAPSTVTVTVNGATGHGRLDSPEPWATHAARFLDLTERFGPWGLALLESILVIADRTASAEESR